MRRGQQPTVVDDSRSDLREKDGNFFLCLIFYAGYSQVGVAFTSLISALDHESIINCRFTSLYKALLS